jgi:hypothetical protein
VANMMGRLVDSDHVVRKYCIRGLGNVGNTHETMVSFYNYSQCINEIELDFFLNRLCTTLELCLYWVENRAT